MDVAAAAAANPTTNPGWYVVLVSVATGLTGLVSTVVSWRRGKRTDALDLYGSFVDDLHSEFARLRAQYDEDLARWSSEKRQMKAEITQLRGEVEKNTITLATLREQLGTQKRR